MTFTTKTYTGDELEHYVNTVWRNYLYIPGYGLNTELEVIKCNLFSDDPMRVNKLNEYICIIGFVDDKPIVNCLFSIDGWFSIYTLPNYRFKGYANKLLDLHKGLIQEYKVKPEPHSTEGLRFFSKHFGKSMEPTDDINIKDNQMSNDRYNSILLTEFVHNKVNELKEPFILDRLDHSIVAAVFVQCVMVINQHIDTNYRKVAWDTTFAPVRVAKVLSDLLTHLSFKTNGELTLKQFDSYLHECINGYMDCLLNLYKVTQNEVKLGYLHK